MSEIKIDISGDRAGALLKDAIIILKQTINTLAGDYGNGDARKKALGKNYTKVQSIINFLYSNDIPL
jgi:hypothetical protein